MGVYIKGMRMPRNCGTCGFRYFKKDECSWYSCSLLSSDTDEGSNGADIQNNCPLVEVPESHGRLVDTTTAYQDTMKYGEHFRKSVLRIINDLPTVIESEE